MIHITAVMKKKVRKEEKGKVLLVNTYVYIVCIERAVPFGGLKNDGTVLAAGDIHFATVPHYDGICLAVFKMPVLCWR